MNFLAEENGRKSKILPNETSFKNISAEHSIVISTNFYS